MIEETCLEIGELEERWETERQARYARRNRIRDIDELLNQLEMLNLADEEEIPLELLEQVAGVVAAESHHLSERPVAEIRILDWMEALYDIQDTLMIPFDDDLD